ncbi:hypothetical protein SASPL_156861 [Salvia splendens]|uniref:Uncharacterized protein n=1 Tax=Salvia splendens TaxID=180675 RepID=A0A8X8VVY0_SALSN|nr:hypothetical protein SASPL_156861 [Salvia splendens]
MYGIEQTIILNYLVFTETKECSVRASAEALHSDSVLRVTMLWKPACAIYTRPLLKIEFPSDSDLHCEDGTEAKGGKGRREAVGVPNRADSTPILT